MSIPVIDFSSACCSDGSTATAAAARDLVHAMETVGFVYLDNVPGFDKQREQRLHEEAKWFFSLPLEEKLLVAPKNWNKQSNNVYRGYVPINVEQGHLREQYEMGGDLPADDPDRCAGNPLYEPTPWPSGERGEAFHQLMIGHYNVMHDAGMKFLQLLACGLGLDEDHFAHKFTPKPTTSLRHYPTYRETGEQRLTCEEHFEVTAHLILLSQVTLFHVYGYVAAIHVVTYDCLFQFFGVEPAVFSSSWVEGESKPLGFLVQSLLTLIELMEPGHVTPGTAGYLHTCQDHHGRSPPTHTPAFPRAVERRTTWLPRAVAAHVVCVIQVHEPHRLHGVH